MIDVLELCSLWILTLLYYQYRQVQLILTSTILPIPLSLSCEVWNTVQRHDVIACHYFETWGKSGRTRILPVALYFSVFSRAVFLEIGIFTRSA